MTTTITDNHTLSLLRYAVNNYIVTVRKYEDYSPSWKTEATWERYWKEMNKLEDKIDALIALREMYNYKTNERIFARYEKAQELRYFVTVNANI